MTSNLATLAEGHLACEGSVLMEDLNDAIRPSRYQRSGLGQTGQAREDNGGDAAHGQLAVPGCPRKQPAM